MRTLRRPVGQQMLRKLSINLNSDLGGRLRRMAFEHSVSESSIIELALDDFLEREPKGGWSRYLQDRGATLRRNNR